MFSLAQLKPLLAGPDLFKRPRPKYPDSVFIEGDIAERKSYIVERLLNKRIRRTRRSYGEIVEYLVKW